MGTIDSALASKGGANILTGRSISEAGKTGRESCKCINKAVPAFLELEQETAKKIMQIKTRAENRFIFTGGFILEKRIYQCILYNDPLKGYFFV